MNNYKAVIFPGQGCQRPGMAEDFYENYSECRSIFQEASNVLSLDMKELCFTENETVNETEFTQPALMIVGYAMFTVLVHHFGFKPRYFAGHSIGEYTALVCSGALTFSDGLQIVRERGRLMQNLPVKGKMAALKMKGILQSEYKSIVEENGVEVANYNSNDQVVISGKSENIEKACTELKKSFPDLECKILWVDIPFHSSLLEMIEKDFEKFLTSFTNIDSLRSSSVLSNYTGTFHKPDELISNLKNQISGSVQWVNNMQKLNELCKEDILEVGPSAVLIRFFEANFPEKLYSIKTLRCIKKTLKKREVQLAS